MRSKLISRCSPAASRRPGLVAAPLLPGMPAERVRPLLGANAPAGTAMLLCTSAARERPLVVRLTHANLMADLRALRRVRAAEPGDVILSVLPPAHLFELMCGVLGPMSCGATIVHQGVPTPDRILARARDVGARAVLLVPALFEMTARHLAGDGAREPRAIAARLRCLPDPEAERRRVRALLGARFQGFVVLWKEDQLGPRLKTHDAVVDDEQSQGQDAQPVHIVSALVGVSGVVGGGVVH